MVDDLAAARGPLERRSVDDARLDQLDVARERGQVLAPASAEIVEDAHVFTRLEARADQMRADEARAAGHEDAHASSSRSQVTKRVMPSSRSIVGA